MPSSKREAEENLRDHYGYPSRVYSMESFSFILIIVCFGHILTYADQTMRPGRAKETHSCYRVRPIPDGMFADEQNRPGLNRTFYKKFTEAYGIPILGSDNVTDDALQRACYVVRFIFAGHSGIRATFYKLGGRFTIMSETEVTLDVPEHSGLNPSFNKRARGLGGTLGNPVTSGAEENLLCKRKDGYRSEDIFVHEVAHGLYSIGVEVAIPGFREATQEAFNNAKSQGLWNNTYAMTNSHEYLAEGVQSYFGVNAEGRPGGGGVHNDINTREELMTYDPALYRLIQQLFPCDNAFLKRCDATRAQEHRQVLQMNCNSENLDLPANLNNPSCPDSQPIKCILWQLAGSCQRTPGYMLRNCKASCNVCPEPPADCVDRNKNCEYWATGNECEKNPLYMLPNCKWSCGQCYANDDNKGDDEEVRQ